MAEADVVCMRCKHGEHEHVLDLATGIVMCMRVMALEQGRPYYCRCQYLDTEERRKQGWIREK
jgi:hypothetical protein